MRRALLVVASFVLVCAGVGLPAQAAEPFGSRPALLRDIVPGLDGSSPDSFARLGGRVLFAAFDATHGRELWVTDGTRAGTRMLKDLLPGTGSSSPRSLTLFKGRVYFTAAVGGVRGLWSSDGTAAGTKQVATSSDARIFDRLTVANGRIWASVSTGTGAQYLGDEPWVSDGTAAGTGLLKDINPGMSGSSPSAFTALGDKVAFLATTTIEGTELWISDGTPQGTSLVKDINVGNQRGPSGELAAMSTPDGPVLVFGATTTAAGTELWRSDGTAARTAMLKEFQAGPNGGTPMRFTAFRGRTYFIAADADGFELWSTDGMSVSTTERVADLNPGPDSGVGTIFGVVGNALMFLGDDGGTHDLFRYDGSTITGVKDLDGGGGYMTDESRIVDGRLVLYLDVASLGSELWTSNGTSTGTRVLADLNPGAGGSAPMEFGVAYNTLLFQADTGGVGPEPYLYTFRGSTTTAKPAASYTRRQARLLRIKVPVVVRGAAGLTGTVVLRKGSTYLGRAKVVDGKATVRITARKLALGKHKVTATYTGSWKARRSVSKPVTFKVR